MGLKVVALDLGSLHLAIRGEKYYDNGKIKPLLFELISFGTTTIDRSFLEKFISVFDSYDFSKFDLILIEGQMGYRGFGRGMNPTTAKLQSYCEFYFTANYPQIPWVIVPASSKYPKELRGKNVSPNERKKWAVQVMTKIFDERDDYESYVKISEAEKGDDLADACLLIHAHLRLHRREFAWELPQIPFKTKK